MFDLMRGVRMCLGWAGLVFMACSLSFFALGEQEGICVDCVKGDQTQHEIQNLNKLTCQKMMRNPECVNVPRVFKADCNNHDPDDKKQDFINACIGTSTGGLIGAMVLIWKISLFIESMTAAGRAAMLAKRTAIGAAVAGGLGALYFGYQFHKAKRDTIGKARSEGWTRKQHTDYTYTILKTRLADKLYNLMYNDAHCYNPVALGVRVCGALTAIAGSVVIGGATIVGGLAGHPVAMGVGAIVSTPAAPLLGVAIGGAIKERASRDQLNEEFNKVRSEVEAKIGESKGSLVPSATENVDRILKEVSQ